MTREQLHSHLEDSEEEILLADGFEDAYMGLATQFTNLRLQYMIGGSVFRYLLIVMV